MTIERRLIERRGAIVDEAAVAVWLGDMDRRAADRRTPVARLSLTLLDPAPDRAPRPAVQPDLAGARGAVSRDEAARSIEAPAPRAAVPHATRAGELAAGVPAPAGGPQSPAGAALATP